MIMLKTIVKRVLTLKEKIQEFLHHPYLIQHISTRQIDEDRILLSLRVLEDANLSEEEIQHHIVPMMLVQIALDTHDEVTNSLPDKANDLLKERQLTVLAGDLYSSLYYNYLAKANHIQLIGLFAEAIKEINEHKIRLYQKDIERIEALFHSTAVIESSLICKMGEYYGSHTSSKFTYYYLLLKRLNKEKEGYLKTERSLIFEQMAAILFSKNKEITKEQKKYLLHICNRYIDHCKEEILKLKLEVNELLKARLSELIGDYSMMAKKTVEEG
ncbi:heptaprenyl diphosphate synthase [Anoxybacillus calidus]|uniref:Heptaprenyl diphosphate synthase n=2 Tax=[Anoxybacillus] calidus TaxID=575178 RepID=A0A7W0BTH6_9BACL|nr:heptaprenyl diphosphate synthase [Anoxybacillus calidus]